MVADTTVRPGVGGLFDGLLPAEVIAAYERLLASDGCARDQVGSLIGDPGLMVELTRRGMAHVEPHTPTDPAWLRPAAPDLALQGVLAGHQTELARGQELLLDGHRRLADAQARYSTGLSSRLPDHLVGMISDPVQVRDLSASLMNTARLSVSEEPLPPPLTAPGVEAPPAAEADSPGAPAAVEGPLAMGADDPGVLAAVEAPAAAATPGALAPAELSAAAPPATKPADPGAPAAHPHFKHWLPWILPLLAIALPLLGFVVAASQPFDSLRWGEGLRSVGRGDFLIPVLALALEAMRTWWVKVTGGWLVGVLRCVSTVLCFCAGVICLYSFEAAASSPVTSESARSVLAITLGCFTVAFLSGTIAVAISRPKKANADARKDGGRC